MINFICLHRREQIPMSNSPYPDHYTAMIWPFEYQGTNYIATASSPGLPGGQGDDINIYKRDEPDSPFKRFRFVYARKVKVRGDKILACRDRRCCLSTIPVLLVMVFKNFGYLDLF